LPELVRCAIRNHIIAPYVSLAAAPLGRYGSILPGVENSMKRAATMNIRTLILSTALLVAVPLFARENTDVLVMKNGDRMTCQVKGLDAGVLYVSFDYVDGTT
jgi:hypothetical protein